MKLPVRLSLLPKLCLLASALTLAACQEKAPTKLTYEMGERVQVGSLTYVIVESAWSAQLGEGFDVRTPNQRFLLLSVSVTNGGSTDISLPPLSLEGPDGKLYQELTDGKGIANWIGLIRSVSPAQTLQGRVAFDVPLTSYRLRLPNGADVGEEKFAFVDVPLRIDDSTVQSPMPGSVGK